MVLPVLSDCEKLLTQKELAARLHVRVETVSSLTTSGALPCHRIGRKPLYHWQEVLQATRERPVTEQVQAALRKTGVQ
jgi:excisionase family DNA binding protein